ncbi:SGNH/GDSL hydrolase family protein [Stenotrophomonas sp.]|uniref:SGNH/GDSL hydrolase family protein n=1 Tax=Stenotrophomonas sp. TaxID=69392 RepID=UPI00289F56DB|nr:SGNH/GDSL hydrolase family protein [Stenotrophomonas sp.]
MTTHNTGNPVPSAAVKDLYDNAENLDSGINGVALTWVDRKGRTRKSMAGVEHEFQQFLADGSTIEFPTWAEASAAAGAGQIPLNRQVAVIGDAGNHADPVSGATVPNSGRYVMGTSGLEWRSADVLSQKADQVELDQTNQKIEPLERIGDKLPPFTVLDSSGRVLAKLTGEEATVFSYERLAAPDAPVPLIVDEQQRVLQYMPGAPSGESAAAASDRGIHAPERMRKMQIFRSGREAGSPSRLSMAIIGDSWVDVTPYWMENFCQRMRARHGDGGIGYVDFGSGTFPRSGLSRVVSGWTVNDETVPGPAIYSRSASGAASYALTVVDAPALLSARMFWIGHSDGVCRYRWNGGAWNVLNVQSVGTNFTDLIGVPAGAGSYTFEVERVSGTIELCGIDLQSDAPGIVIHKLGNSGSRADDWLGVNAEHWQQGIAGLAPGAVMILLGTNDKTAGISAELFASEIAALIGRVRAALPDTTALPGPDVMVVVPSQVWRSTSMPMADYRDAILAAADGLGLAVIDLIDAVGNPYTRRSWFDADGVHPTPEAGGLIVSGRIFEALHS